MDALWSILKNVIIFVALAMPGYILVKTKILKSSESGALSKLLTYVGMPFLILSSTMSINLNADFALTAGLSAVFCLIITFGAFFLSGLTPTKKSDGEQPCYDTTRGAMRFSMIFSNNGFLGIPLAMAVFADNPTIVAIVVIMNIINNLCLYTVGSYLISGDKSTVSVKKALFNPLIIAFALGIILNLSGVNNYVPEISEYSNYLKNIVTPVSMIILGIKLADIKISTLFTSRLGYVVSVVKLVVLPIIATAIAFLLAVIFNLSNDIVFGFFIAFAMPTAGLAPTLADTYGGDTKNATVFTLSSTILSVLTIPLLYMLLCLI